MDNESSGGYMSDYELDKGIKYFQDIREPHIDIKDIDFDYLLQLLKDFYNERYA